MRNECDKMMSKLSMMYESENDEETKYDMQI
jgi:hypothetical protein